jgi:glyoxylase-like metal-dependent hydrolase (beta-lactamase superfamily II)
MKNACFSALAALLLLGVSGHAQDARAAVDAAAAALGVANLKTVQFSGWGYDYVFGQAYNGDSRWPRFNLPGYTMTIDYAAPAMRDDRRRTQLEDPPLGGGFQPMFGEQRLIAVVNGNYAWDVVGDTASLPGFRNDRQTNVRGRTDQIWLTPHGFIKLAMASTAAVRTETIRGAKKTIVTVTHPTYGTFEGTLDAQHLVERIDRWFGHSVLGDALMEATFSDYNGFNGVTFPTRIQQREGGYPLLDLTVTDVRVNPSVTLDVPANIRTAAAPGPLVGTPEKLADGVWLFPTYAKSVAVEFRDYVAVIEAAETEAQSIETIDALEKVVPNKPIRYLINTHSHFDHIGGMRTFAAEGATIITHHANIPYFQSLWANPRTIAPDRLSRSGREATFEGVVGNRMLSDGSRRLLIHHYPGNMHNPGMLMMYLPKEKILIEADSFSPPAVPLTAPPNALANLQHFVESVDRLKLDVEQVVPIHGRVTALDEAREILARFKSNQTR